MCVAAGAPRACALADALGPPAAGMSLSTLAVCLLPLLAGSTAPPPARYGLFVSAEWFTHEPEAIDLIWAAATRLRHLKKDCPIFVEVCCDHSATSPQYPIEPVCHWSNKTGSEAREALAALRAAGDVTILRYIHTSKMHNKAGCCRPAETIGNVTKRVAEELKASPDDGIFFDDVMAIPEYMPVYRAGWNASQSSGKTKRVVAWNPDCMKPHIPEHNPWCKDTPEEYMQMGDYHVLYEGLAAAFAPNTSQLQWDPAKYRNKMTAYIYNASVKEWKSLVDRGRAAGFTKFCMTGTKAEGPPGAERWWPSFLDEMADYLAGLNAAVASQPKM